MKKRLLAAVIAVFALLLLLRPEAAEEAVRGGLALCFQTVVPSLFPFFVVVSLLLQLGLGRWLGRLFSPFREPLSLRSPDSGGAIPGGHPHTGGGGTMPCLCQQLRPRLRTLLCGHSSAPQREGRAGAVPDPRSLRPPHRSPPMPPRMPRPIPYPASTAPPAQKELCGDVHRRRDLLLCRHAEYLCLCGPVSGRRRCTAGPLSTGSAGVL